MSATDADSGEGGGKWDIGDGNHALVKGVGQSMTET